MTSAALYIQKHSTNNITTTHTDATFLHTNSNIDKSYGWEKKMFKSAYVI